MDLLQEWYKEGFLQGLDCLVYAVNQASNEPWAIDH